MTITRVQQVTGVLSGTSDTITLPSTPQYGSTLIAIFARAGVAPIATSLTQDNVTWTSLASGSNARDVSHHVFYAQKVTTAAGTAITVTRSDSDDYAYAVFEYAGLLRFGTLLDQTVTASEDGYTPYTTATAPTTQAQELALAALPHVYPERILDDTLLTDQGYWRVDTSIPSSITFTGTAADVTGVVVAEPTGSASWNNYRVAVDVASTSAGPSSIGWFGIGLYGAGEYGAPTGNAYAGLINTNDNTVYAFKLVNGVISWNAYPYGGFGTLNPGQQYRLELRARTTLANDVLLEFFVDGTLIYTETHSGGPTAGTVALAVQGASPQVATFNNLLVNELSGTLVRQVDPSNDFAIVSQSSIADAADSRVNLVVAEKQTVTTGAQNVTTQTDDWVVWNTRLLALFAELASVFEKTAALDQYIADEFAVAAVLSPVIAEENTPSVTLEVQIQPVIGCFFDVSIGADGFLISNMDVLLDLGVEAELDMYLVGTVEQTTGLSVTVGIQTFPVNARLDLFVAGLDLRIATKLDLAVLVPPPLINVTTTPDAYRYLECRSLWCNVPKVRGVTTRYDVLVGGYGAPTVQLNMHIETGRTRLVALQVFSAPIPDPDPWPPA